MCKAPEFVIKSGGVAKVRTSTRIWLAIFGLLPWDEVPQLPMDLILIPSWSPINIYTLSSWARLSLIPLLLVKHHQSTFSLLNGTSTRNNFLDELWCNPANKSSQYAPPLWDLLGKKEMIGGLHRFPFHGYLRQKVVQRVLDHQEISGDWAGY